MMGSSTALVITSISGPNPVLRSFAEGCARRGIRFILIGDKPSPKDFQLDGCDFWSLERQREMSFELARLLPERHYGRKNLGYLQAISSGAQVILESDDDNFPREEFWGERTAGHKAEVLRDANWVNLYRYFSSERIWPRGYPLEHLQKELPKPGAAETLKCPIQQGLADENPDVDAIYRLAGVLPLDFDDRAPIALGSRSWCPFNSQNTTWTSEAFPLLYLPSYCSFRMTDIWRSYIAVRICWENDWNVLFHKSTVWQERNAHDLMKDFADELIGYQNNKAICERLEGLELKRGVEHIFENMRSCYNEFIEMGLVGREELPLIEAWIRDMQALGADRPKVVDAGRGVI
jgi:hypothetical protein